MGDHLRRKRLLDGWTRRRLARFLRVDPDTISNWEAGATSPALRLLPRALDYLGFDPRATAESDSLGDRLWRARTAAGLSIDELARKWSVDPTTIWKWEHGRNRPGIRYRRPIRELTGTAQAAIETGQSLGDRIRAYRERHGLRQTDLARMVGARQQHVSDWERGAKVPKGPRLVRLHAALEGISQTH